MAPKTTRTLHPLPFLELEPHRFEDMVRQLAYDFREWGSLEAVGRSGGDEGTDIRGVELVRDAAPIEPDEEVPPQTTQRLWVFQCKREKSMGPAKVAKAVQESIPAGAAAPYGFVLATACDLSHQARERFRTEVLKRGVQEFFVWSRGELEDMLFQPKNDRLLFVYFNLSLGARKRSVGAEIRSRVALKKQFLRLFSDEDRSRDRYVVIRDPADLAYPKDARRKGAAPSWLVCEYLHCKSPIGPLVVFREHLARVSPDHQTWDAILKHNTLMEMAHARLRAEHAWCDDDNADDGVGPARDFWLEYVPEGERAHLKIIGVVPFERIVAIDPIGDGYYPVPHIFADFSADNGPFDRTNAYLEFGGEFAPRIDLEPGEETRSQYFPDPLPEDLYPPPTAFEFQSKHRTPKLSTKTVEQVRKLVKATRRNRQRPDQECRASDAPPDPREAFLGWRGATAEPVMTNAMLLLRREGQDARIAVESSIKDGYQGRDAIALRVRRQTGSPMNPSYKPSGHLAYERQHDGMVKMKVSPLKQDSSGTYRGEHDIFDVGALTKDVLEQHIVEFLGRLMNDRI